MIDLSKLPWHECELPRFKGRNVHARCSMIGNFAHIEAEAEGFYPIATQCGDEHSGRWEYCSCTLDELELITRMCRIVELFIDRHTEQRPTIREPESCTTNKGAE